MSVSNESTFIGIRTEHRPVSITFQDPDTGDEYKVVIHNERTLFRFNKNGVEETAWLDQCMLPPEIHGAFEEIWALHPEVRDKFMKHQVPRWVQSYEVGYKYSGRKHESAGPTPTASLRRFRAFAEALYQTKFQQVLLNWYEKPTDHISKHADNEIIIRPDSEIVSLSMGQTPRQLIIRGAGSPFPVSLDDNTVIVMGGAFQRLLTHEVKRPTAAQIASGSDLRRVNVTLRQFVEIHPNPNPKQNRKRKLDQA